MVGLGVHILFVLRYGSPDLTAFLAWLAGEAGCKFSIIEGDYNVQRVKGVGSCTRAIETGTRDLQYCRIMVIRFHDAKYHKCPYICTLQWE